MLTKGIAEHDEDIAAWKAYGHEFQSQGVIEMPKNRLLDQFIAGRTELKKEEMNT